MAHRTAPSLTALLSVLVLGLGACGSSDDDPAAGPSRTPPGTASPQEPDAGLTLLVIGDSIPYNAPEDCPGCTAFADLYAQQLGEATGRDVEVQNLSDHTGLTVERLLREMEPLEDDIAAADAIVVGIAHNSYELATEEPCGRPVTAAGVPRWEAVDARCAADAAAASRPLFDRVFTRVAALREGEPTLLLTLNRYNDWIGWPDGGLTAEEDRRTAVLSQAWNAMICTSAESHGFGCADLSRAFNGPDGTRPSGDLLADDYTHPSQQGNDVIAEELASLGFAPLA